MSLVNATNSKYPWEVQVCAFQKYDGLEKSGMKYASKPECFFDEMVCRKKVLSDSSQCIYNHFNVDVEVFEVQFSVAFELSLNDQFI